MPKVYSAFSVWPRLFWSKVKWGWGNKSKSETDGDSRQHQVLIYSSSCILNNEHEIKTNKECCSLLPFMVGFRLQPRERHADLASYQYTQLIKYQMLLCRRATKQPSGRHMWDDQRHSEQLHLRLFVFVAHSNSCGRFVFSSKCNENVLFVGLTSKPLLKHMFWKNRQTGCLPAQYLQSRWKHKCGSCSLNWVSLTTKDEGLPGEPAVTPLWRDTTWKTSGGVRCTKWNSHVGTAIKTTLHEFCRVWLLGVAQKGGACSEAICWPKAKPKEIPGSS